MVAGMQMRGCVSHLVSYHIDTHRKMWPERVSEDTQFSRSPPKAQPPGNAQATGTAHQDQVVNIRCSHLVSAGSGE
jgi:hypothetical protein